jgi:hypothetical protein
MQLEFKDGGRMNWIREINGGHSRRKQLFLNRSNTKRVAKSKEKC